MYSERKIDLIDSRLEAMDEILEELKTQNVNTDRASPLSYRTSESVSGPSPQSCLPHRSEPATGPIVEGQSSLSAHSVFVKDFLHNFVQSDVRGQSDQQIRRTLVALTGIANTPIQHDATGHILPASRELNNAQQRGHALPPIQMVAPLIRLAKGKSFARL